MIELPKIKIGSNGTYIDLYSTYGVRFLKGAYLEFLRIPQVKEYITNESRLENGTRYLNADMCRVKAKEISVKISIEASSYGQMMTRYNQFIELLKSGEVHLNIPFLGFVFKLVYKDCKPIATYNWKCTTFTLEMIEPNPTDRQ